LIKLDKRANLIQRLALLGVFDEHNFDVLIKIAVDNLKMHKPFSGVLPK
jgi:hypothetical protein